MCFDVADDDGDDGGLDGDAYRYWLRCYCYYYWTWDENLMTIIIIVKIFIIPLLDIDY